MFETIFLTLIIAAEIGLGFVALKKDPKNNINRFFAMMVWCMSLWGIALFLFQQPVPQALCWGRLVFTVTFLTGFALLVFSYYFPATTMLSAKTRRFFPAFFKIYFLYVATLCILSLSTDLIMKDIVFMPSNNNFTTGPLYFTFILHMAFSAITSFIILIVKSRRLSGFEKAQTFYLFLGLFVSGVSTIFTNLIWPLAMKNNELSRLGPLSMIFLIGCTTYAISKYRLMDIRVVLRKATVYILMIVLFLTFILGSIFTVAWFWAKRIPDYSLVFTGSFVFTIVLLLFDSTKRFFEKFANRYFFTSLYNQEQTLTNLSEKMTSLIDFRMVLDLIITTIASTMGLDRACIVLLDEKKEHYRISLNMGFEENPVKEVINDEMMTAQILKEKKLFVLRELKFLEKNTADKEVKKRLNILIEKIDKAGVKTCLFLINKGRMIGLIMLGEKVSGDAYTTEDLKMLERIANEAAIIIENAMLYKKVQEFNLTLQEKVNRQTYEITEANKHLQELLRMKTEFLSIASHQLRTPLTAVKGYLSMILENVYGKPTTKMKKPLENVYVSNERLLKLVNDLLNVSRIETGKLEFKSEKTSIDNLIVESIREMELQVKEKNLYLKFEKPKKPLPEIIIDKDKIMQAILNLIDNAIKYTPKGGIDIKTEITNGKYIIKVKDTGEGMAPEEISRLFESFSRGKAGSKLWTEGSGLGLYTAKKFIDMHKGKIWAESEGRGKGSTFFIELPM